MKKVIALFLTLLLMFSLCAVLALADNETAAIVLEPADEKLLTAEGLALFFVDRDAVEEEIETSVSWYKETTKDGKTERELVEEMPLVLTPGKGGAPTRIFVADGYKPTQELIDLVEKYAPEKDKGSEHEYRWHRIFNQDCRWRGLRYSTCRDCFGIEFDLASGEHVKAEKRIVVGSGEVAVDIVYCTICGHVFSETYPEPTVEPPPTPTPTPTVPPTYTP